MAFTVSYQKDSGITVKDDFGDEAVYDFVEGGVLKIISPDNQGKLSFTAANVWRAVSADKDHKPGRPKGGKGGGRRATVLS